MKPSRQRDPEQDTDRDQGKRQPLKPQPLAAAGEDADAKPEEGRGQHEVRVVSDQARARAQPSDQRQLPEQDAGPGGEQSQARGAGRLVQPHVSGLYAFEGAPLIAAARPLPNRPGRFWIFPGAGRHGGAWLVQAVPPVSSCWSLFWLGAAIHQPARAAEWAVPQRAVGAAVQAVETPVRVVCRRLVAPRPAALAERQPGRAERRAARVAPRRARAERRPARVERWPAEVAHQAPAVRRRVRAERRPAEAAHQAPAVRRPVRVEAPL